MRRSLWRSFDRFSLQHFRCFMEYQILAEFLRVLKISANSSIEAPLLQYLGIIYKIWLVTMQFIIVSAMNTSTALYCTSIALMGVIWLAILYHFLGRSVEK